MFMADDLFGFVTPVLGTPILEPKDRSRRIGRDMLLVRHDNRLAFVLEDFHRVERVAQGLVVQAADHALVGNILARL